jgi:hypothetical protein
MGTHQLPPPRTFLPAHQTYDEADTTWTTAVGFSHDGRLSNPPGNFQWEIALF